MKMLTLNAHSHLEADYERKIAGFVDFVLRERPDLIAMQEVSQSADAPEAEQEMLTGMTGVFRAGIPVRSDNHAARIAGQLIRAGLRCRWAWLPVKLGYGRFDEGLAIFSLSEEIADVDVVNISRCDDYRNWKTRKALGVRLEGQEDWFYTVHMGWWDDHEEPFSRQWEKLNRSLADRKARTVVWLMGDFNSPAEVRGEGYDCIRDSGWQDAWLLARETRGEATVKGVIDGWRSRAGCESVEERGMRIDHIWCSHAVPVLRARTVLDGRHEMQVSDHYGVMLETENNQSGGIDHEAVYLHHP